MDSSLAHLMSWSETTKGDVPPPLTGPSITISPLPAPHPPTIFMFGGKFVHNRKLTNEMWAMDHKTRIWSRIIAGPGPGPRYFHSMDVWEDKLVCFGGISETDPMSVHNDIWFFDCSSRKWMPQPTPSIGLGVDISEQDRALTPSARYAHLSAVTRSQLVISGGQHSDNSWVYEINVYDLRQKRWVSKTLQPELQGQHSKGAYRSVAASSKQRVITPKGADMKTSSSQTYSIEEEGEGGQIWCYSNYDFAKVRRELDLFTPANEVVDIVESTKHSSPPSVLISDQSDRMRGSSQPPGLRFPTGGIVGNHFILCGLYLASSSAAFSIWSLDLATYTWRHLEPAVLSTGSWNRAVLWPEKAKILVFGNTEYDLASDYGRRAVNLDNMAVISLETFGIYQPPRLEIAPKIQEVGLSMMDGELASDFEVICDDGRKIKCSRQLLSERWHWFAVQEKELNDRLNGAVKDQPTIDIADTLLGNFTPARLMPTSLEVPEPFPVCVALVQYFYTLSLSTPLQNRAPVLSALLFLAKQYRIDRLAKLVVHALHERLDASIAVGIYEIATLAGEQELQVRALNMIHTAKAGTTSRSHRQGPPGSLVNDGRSNSPALGAPGPSAPSQADSGTTATGVRVEGDTFRRARAESMTLVDEVAEQVDSLLAAMSVSAEDACMPSPVDPDQAPPVPRRSAGRPAPTIGPAPTTRQFTSQKTPILRTPDLSDDGEHRPDSPTNTESTGYPATPAESIRESYILPHGYPMDSRSSSTSSHSHGSFDKMALPPLPEDHRTLHRFRTINGSRSSETSLRSYHSQHSDKERVKPSTLESAGMYNRAPPPALSSYQAQAIASAAQAQTDMFGRYPKVPKHFSVATSSSSSSIASQKLTAPGSPVATEYSFVLDDPPRVTAGPSMSMSTLPTARGYASTETESIMTTSSGGSSKKQLKAEKKAIADAAKAAKKAEAQARFEALRSEQMQKMAIAKAEVQRREEMAKFAPAPETKPAPKSKLGKFGSKFTSAVLFPEGGKNSTMF